MHIVRCEPLQHRNTFAFKSWASAYVQVVHEQELLDALEWANEHDMNVLPLGHGSNVVLAGDIDALVIHPAQRGIDLVEDNGDTVVLKVAAGESWHSLVQWSLQHGYFGLENLALIPGTVGAAPIQNIGAYGVEIASFIRCVSMVNIGNGQVMVMDARDCNFGYRDSIFKNVLRDKVVITSIELILSRKPCLQLSYPALNNYLNTDIAVELTPQALYDAVVAIRQSRLPDPGDTPNAGSFFKNPLVAPAQVMELLKASPDMPHYSQENGQVKVPAAWLIDRCGWKGKRVGKYGVHPAHALVLVNYGGDDGNELLALARDIAASVRHTYGVDLEIEPRVYGGE